ncbi:uncharacterized protein BKCO1_6300017 [Diplodia corticola]|uniref:Uncharacterized protein n=1 Tax=Diplodia corticola TaxID=236234 RepID=A0A1J9QN20_9PEZI|nr:uncharacterized protein BKCO1_6300017 [Diplodia corticola]OJD30286.1 hypothetical protein BKCO1_6300017 [Diplodia corticola]
MYLVTTVSPVFFTGAMQINVTKAPFTLTTRIENMTTVRASSQEWLSDQELQAISSLNRSQPEMLPIRQCVEAYSKPFQNTYRNLFVVLDTAESNTVLSTRTSSPRDIQPYSWICDGTRANSTGFCSNQNLQESAVSWSLDGDRVKYCLCERAAGLCELNFHHTLLIIVISANAAKLVAMLVLLNFFDESALITLGDAIASFMDEPDPTTRGMCLADHKVFCSKRNTDGASTWTCQKRRYTPNGYPVRWFRTVSFGQWVRTFSIMICVLLATIVLCVTATRHVAKVNPDQDMSLKGLFSMGFGALRISSTLTNISSRIEVLVIVANIPQLVLSFAYVLVNRVLSGMASSREWASFAHKRAGLRVTRALGEQRSTYYLQLPYSLAVPQIATSIAVHYIVSQSVFASRVQIYDYLAQGQQFDEYRALGFSAIAIIAGIVLWFFIMAALLGLGLVKNRPGMPPVGFWSAAISAACHPPRFPQNTSLKKVMWGEIKPYGSHDAT